MFYSHFSFSFFKNRLFIYMNSGGVMLNIVNDTATMAMNHANFPLNFLSRQTRIKSRIDAERGRFRPLTFFRIKRRRLKWQNALGDFFAVRGLYTSSVVMKRGPLLRTWGFSICHLYNCFLTMCPVIPVPLNFCRHDRRKCTPPESPDSPSNLCQNV